MFYMDCPYMADRSIKIEHICRSYPCQLREYVSRLYRLKGYKVLDFEYRESRDDSGKGRFMRLSYDFDECYISLRVWSRVIREWRFRLANIEKEEE